MSNPDSPANADPLSDPDSSEIRDPKPSQIEKSSKPNDCGVRPQISLELIVYVLCKLQRSLGTCRTVVIIAVLLLCFYIGLDLLGTDKGRLVRKLPYVSDLLPPSPSPAATPTPALAIPADSTYSAFVEAARKADRPYIIEGATMFGEITDAKSAKGTSRILTWYVSYTIRALKDISRSHPVFYERYEIPGAVLIPWSGTEVEKDGSSPGNEYDVAFDLKAGELRNFTTGVDYSYQLPMRERLAFHKKFTLKENEDYLTYTGGDFVGHLTVIVRSKSTELKPWHPETAVRLTGDNLVFSEAKFSPISARSGWHTLSASWSYISPEEEAGIVFQWP